MDANILEMITHHVDSCFEKDTPGYLLYHNISHTHQVVDRSKEISDFYKIADSQKFILLAAAWFHDLGFLYATPQLHETTSVSLMENYLNPYCPEEILNEIGNTILSTKFPTHPNNFLESIICDADSYHFGTEQFFITDELVRKEMEARTGINFKDWKQHSLNLLKSHQFYTLYCQENLNAGKEKNISILESQL